VYEKYPNARIEMWWRDKSYHVLKAVPSVELQLWKDMVARMLEDLEAKIKKDPPVIAQDAKEVCDGKNS
jgi:hypothetical protein